MRDCEMYLNGFAIKEELIPKYAYEFSLIFIDERPEEIYRIIKGQKYKGIPLTSVNKTEIRVVSWLKPEQVKKVKKISLSDLPRDKQEELVNHYLKNELKLNNELTKFLKPRKKGDLLIIPSIVGSVKKINGKFYYFFDIRRRIRTLKSVYTLVKEGKLRYEDLIDRELLYEAPEKSTKRRIFTVSEINLNPLKEEVNEIIQYLRKKYKFTGELFPEVIIYGKFKDDESRQYPFFPQFCYLEKRSIPAIRELVIPNEKRLSLLSSLAAKSRILSGKPLHIKGKEFKKPEYVVKLQKGKFVKVSSLKETLKYPPLFVPEILKKQKEIPFIVLLDKSLQKKDVELFLLEQRKLGFFRLGKKESPISFKASISKSGNFSFQVDFKNFKIPREVQQIIDKYHLKLALCIGPELDEDSYDKIKRKLFVKNVISQYVIFTRWKCSPEFISQNLSFNIYNKLGIRLFTLAEKLPYDLILGIDVGNDRFNKRSKAGAVTVFLSSGLVKTAFPYSTDTGGEKIVYLGELIEILAEKLNLYNKKLLILRDGYLYKDEIKNLIESKIVEQKSLKIDLVNIKKNHAFRILSDKGKKAVILRDDLAILLSHSIEGARSLLIDMAISIRKDGVRKLNITYPLLETIYKLTKLNLSTVFREDCLLRLPAPSHYSDKLVKALKKNWNIDEELLEAGCLYFL